MENEYSKFFENGCTDEAVERALRFANRKVHRRIATRILAYYIKTTGIFPIQDPPNEWLKTTFQDDRVLAFSYGLVPLIRDKYGKTRGNYRYVVKTDVD